MWNRFGRVVTLEVCADVATTLIVATVPCPRISQVLSLPIGPSIHVGRVKTSLNGISPSRGMALLPHITAMHRVVGAFVLTFPMLHILAYCTFCELCSQRYPNLLPVAGGGGAALTLRNTVPYSSSYCITRILFLGHSVFRFVFSLILSVTI